MCLGLVITADGISALPSTLNSIILHRLAEFRGSGMAPANLQSIAQSLLNTDYAMKWMHGRE